VKTKAHLHDMISGHPSRRPSPLPCHPAVLAILLRPTRTRPPISYHIVAVPAAVHPLVAPAPPR